MDNLQSEKVISLFFRCNDELVIENIFRIFDPDKTGSVRLDFWHWLYQSKMLNLPKNLSKCPQFRFEQDSYFYFFFPSSIEQNYLFYIKFKNYNFIRLLHVQILEHFRSIRLMIHFAQHVFSYSHYIKSFIQ